MCSFFQEGIYRCHDSLACYRFLGCAACRSIIGCQEIVLVLQRNVKSMGVAECLNCFCSSVQRLWTLLALPWPPCGLTQTCYKRRISQIQMSGRPFLKMQTYTNMRASEHLKLTLPRLALTQFGSDLSKTYVSAKKSLR